MTFALLIAVFGLIIVTLMQYRFIKRVKSEVTSIFIAKSKDKPSEFASAVDTVLDYSIEKVTASLKGRFAALSSHVARQENELARDITADQLEKQNPALGFLFSQLPKKWQNKVVQNPNAAMAAMNLLTKSGGIAGGNGNGGGKTANVNDWFK